MHSLCQIFYRGLLDTYCVKKHSEMTQHEIFPTIPVRTWNFRYGSEESHQYTSLAIRQLISR